MMRSEQVARQLHEAQRDGALLRTGKFALLQRDEVAMEAGGALHRLRDPEGTRRCGWKLGHTSAAMRQQMGMSEPTYAPIYAAEIVAERAIVIGLVHPRVEPEVAVKLTQDLAWSDLEPLVTDDRQGFLQSRRASNRCALEIVGSVWDDYCFTWGENTADGSSGPGAALGDSIPLDALDVRVTSRNYSAPGIHDAAQGTSSDVFGHPLDAVVWLIQQLGDHGKILAAGELVLTGSVTALLTLLPGILIKAEFSWGQRRGQSAAERPIQKVP